MIRKVQFENFMCLKNVPVDLEPLTIFVGPNASGKSAIFKGLVTLSKLLGGQPVRGPKGEFFLEEGVTLDKLVWSGNSGLPIRFSVWFAEDTNGSEPGYTLELSKRAAGWSVTHEKIRTGNGWIEVDEEHSFGHPTERETTKRSWKCPLRAPLRYLVEPFSHDSDARPIIEPILRLADQFGQTWRYRPSASDIARFVQRAPEAKAGKFWVRENGWGLALELQDLQGRKREVFTAIEKEACALFPHISAIGFESDWQGVRLTYNTNRSEDPVSAPQESDGVLIATFLLWRLHTASPSLRVCLEEPESGLHPHLLGDRYELLRRFTYPKEGSSAVQILVATHSPHFLRVVKSHPGKFVRQLRVVDFDSSSGTSVHSLSHYREATKLYEKYSAVSESSSPSGKETPSGRGAAKGKQKGRPKATNNQT